MSGFSVKRRGSSSPNGSPRLRWPQSISTAPTRGPKSVTGNGGWSTGSSSTSSSPSCAPGAEFFFATDFDDYGIDVAGFMPQIPGMTNMLAPDLFRYELEGYHLSRYMEKFMAEGKKIHFVHYRKVRSCPAT